MMSDSLIGNTDRSI